MDVAYYLSELLMQNGEVNVPGLGYFALLKVEGYYDNAQNKFYPPSNKIQFDPQYHDDDVLLQYIADKKRISLASSKYFTAKFIDNLKQEAMLKQVPLADLGTFNIEDARLHFSPAAVLPLNPAYYGYQPVAIDKLGGTSFHEQLEKEMPEATYFVAPPLPHPAPAIPIHAPPIQEEKFVEQTPEIVIPRPVDNAPPVVNSSPPVIDIASPVVDSTPLTDDVEQEFVFHGRGYSGEEEKSNNNNWIWITITVIVVLGIIGAFALYKFNPATFNKLIGKQQVAPVVLKAPVKSDTVKTIAPVVKPDSTTKKIIADTTVKAASVNTPVSAVDSTQVRFEVIGIKAKTIEEANKVIANYKSIDVDAHIVTGTPGSKFYVSLGTYETRKEATEAINNLIKSGKVKKDIWPFQINPQK